MMGEATQLDALNGLLFTAQPFLFPFLQHSLEASRPAGPSEIFSVTLFGYSIPFPFSA
jgi:hypothetical protein